MVYKRRIHADKILDTESVISGIENQYCIDELKIASNNVQHLQRGSNSDKINQSMPSNSKLYKNYLDAKKKLARLRTSTPISVVVDVNSNPPQITTFPTSPLTQTSTITDH